MKHLLIVRHAKSSWSNDAMTDFERPLNARGERTAPLVAKHLAETIGVQVDSAISSPALRAISTARLLCPALGVRALNPIVMLNKQL